MIMNAYLVWPKHRVFPPPRLGWVPVKSEAKWWQKNAAKLSHDNKWGAAIYTDLFSCSWPDHLNNVKNKYHQEVKSDRMQMAFRISSEMFFLTQSYVLSEGSYRVSYINLDSRCQYELCWTNVSHKHKIT